MVFILVLAICFWFGGYLMTARTMSTTGVLSSKLETIIAPPMWLYYLCGAPRSKDYPRGTMRVAAFQVQIFGILLMVFLVYSRIGKTSEMENLIGLALATVAAYVITPYVSKKYTVNIQTKNKKRYSMIPTKITDDLSCSIEGSSINLYSEFGGNGGADITIDFDEIDAVIEALQNIKASLQGNREQTSSQSLGNAM